jgi:hypothetical protein
MTLTATEYPLVQAEATEQLEGRGYRIFLSTEHTLEAGNGTQVLQVIRLDDGEYRATRISQANPVEFPQEATKLPEMGEVLKWLEADGHAKG